MRSKPHLLVLPQKGLPCTLSAGGTLPSGLCVGRGVAQALCRGDDMASVSEKVRVHGTTATVISVHVKSA